MWGQEHMQPSEPKHTCLQKTLSKAELEESAERLSKPKEVIKASTVRPKAVQLKYKYKKELRGGKGGFAELLVPAKKSSLEEKQVRVLERSRILGVKLSACCCKYKKELRGGKGGFAELLVHAKKSSLEEKQVASIASNWLACLVSA